MDAETRAAFARLDRCFGLLQAQYLELRLDMTGLRRDVNSCLDQVGGLRRDVNSCLEQIAELRRDVAEHRRETSAAFEQLGAFRRDVTVRLDALARR